MGKRAKKTPVKKKIILFLISLVTIAALIGGYFLVFNKNDGQKAEPELVIKKAGQATGSDKNGVVRILVLGSDSRGSRIGGSRSDANMLVQLNPDKSANIVSFPRDSKVSIGGRGSGKINSALALGGPELTVRTVESYSGLDIDYYVVASFPRFTGIINAVGGVKFHFDKPLNDSLAGANFSAGTKKLTGGQALALSRARHIAGGDFSRQANQQKFAIAAYKQERKKLKNMGLMIQLVAILRKRVETDLSSGEMFTLMRKAFMTEPDKIDATVLKGSTGGSGGASYVFLDRAYANKVFAKMKAKQ